MKIRKMIFTTTMSALVCFGLCQQVQSATDTPDPGGSLPTSNTADGQGALGSLTTGLYNSAFGFLSVLSLSDGNFDTGVGAGALLVDNGGTNTAVGAGALFSNTDADNNTATGAFALFSNVIASSNTAVGSQALQNNDNTGNGNANGNTAVGTQALFSNGDGAFNDAVGAFALVDNTDGFGNNAFGNSALFSNVIGAENTALGDVALAFNDSDGMGLANNNTAVGGAAMFNNVDGSENTAVGAGAGPNLIAGVNNTYVGDFVGTVNPSGTPLPDESNTIRIGDLSNGNGAGSEACFIGGIFNNLQPVNGTNIVQVTLNLSDDHLGYDLGPSQGGSAPVQRGAPARRSAPQPRGRPQHQAKLNDKVGKLQATVAQQQEQIEVLQSAATRASVAGAMIARQQKQIETLTAQLKEQAAQIQRVSAQLELSKSAPQTVLNNQ